MSDHAQQVLATGTDFDEYSFTLPQQIRYHLNQLIDHGERISVVFDEGRETLLTVLLRLDAEEGVLYFDRGGSEAGNRRLLQSKRIYFVCAPQGIRNQFATESVRETTDAGVPAFATPLPHKYLRLQRRQFFRLILPVTRRLPCRLPTPPGEREWWINVTNIGVGGVGMEIAAGEADFVPGEILAGAEIDLPGPGRLTMDLEVRHCGLQQRGNKPTGRLGCRILHLSSVDTHRLERFITHTQREERARGLASAG
jgi:c-di-GMP-binding flagellar brake protein YcgR